MLIGLWMACSGPVDETDARALADRHEATLLGVHERVAAVVATLPSLPGDRFFCRETTAPPGVGEAEAAAMQQGFCRQQEAYWHSDRYKAEERLFVPALNSAFLNHGVVGIEISLAGPAGVEWSDHRGVFAFKGDTAVPAERGVSHNNPAAVHGDWLLGFGTVDLSQTIDGVMGLPRNAFEWRATASRREATATVRLFVLAAGTPDGRFVQRALATAADLEAAPGQ